MRKSENPLGLFECKILDPLSSLKKSQKEVLYKFRWNLDWTTQTRTFVVTFSPVLHDQWYPGVNWPLFHLDNSLIDRLTRRDAGREQFGGEWSNSAPVIVESFGLDFQWLGDLVSIKFALASVSCHALIDAVKLRLTRLQRLLNSLWSTHVLHKWNISPKNFLSWSEYPNSALSVKLKFLFFFASRNETQNANECRLCDTTTLFESTNHFRMKTGGWLIHAHHLGTSKMLRVVSWKLRASNSGFTKPCSYSLFTKNLLT